MKKILTICLLAIASVVLSAQEKDWVASWAPALQVAEPHNCPPEPFLEGNSLRQIIQLSTGGDQFRIRLSNIFNEDETQIVSVEVAKALTMGESPEIDKKTVHKVLFNGSKAVTMKAGESIVSDVLDFPVSNRENLAVTIRFGKVSSTCITSHPGSRTSSYIATGKKPDFSKAVRTDHWYILSGVDVRAREFSRLVCVIGDSITDGRGTTTNGQNRWTDVLSRRLLMNPTTQNVAVVNKGLGGNNIVRGGLGPAAQTRFGRDIFEEPGVRYVILFEGVNDIGTSFDPLKTVSEIIRIYKDVIEDIHSRGLKVFGATVMPFEGNGYFTAEKEAARQALNAWIRNYKGFDGLIDFDAVMRDPQNPQRLREKYLFENDWLHVNAQGYFDMGSSIDLKLFED
ncbi:MAG: SGNH/GDSL hydrolase family protein [Bacteroidales bacterium]|nr:SGNH/GDSL hydrolase family protein [Bacteroidales bacterium]